MNTTRPEPSLRGGVVGSEVKPLEIDFAGQPKTVIRMTLKTRAILDPAFGKPEPATFSFALDAISAERLILSLAALLHYIDPETYPEKQVVEAFWAHSTPPGDGPGDGMVAIELGHVPLQTVGDMDPGVLPRQDFLLQPQGARTLARMMTDFADQLELRGVSQNPREDEVVDFSRDPGVDSTDDASETLVAPRFNVEGREVSADACALARAAHQAEPDEFAATVAAALANHHSDRMVADLARLAAGWLWDSAQRYGVTFDELLESSRLKCVDS